MRPSFLQQLANALLQILEAFNFILRHMIGKPLKAVGRLFQPDNTKLEASIGGRGKKPRKNWWKKIIINPISETARLLFRFFIAIITFPYRFTKHLWSQTRAELLWCIPAILAVCLMGFVVTRVFVQNAQIQRRYRSDLSKALRSGDYEYGKTVCQRLVSWGGESYDNDRLNLAVCMLNTGDGETAYQILDELAPNSEVGYAPAHRFKAMILGQQLSQTKDSKILNPLRFHLEHSKDSNSEAVQAIYGLYYIETNQPKKAIQYLRIAAKKNPKHYLTLASIYEEQEDESNKRQMLREAERGFRTLLESNPTEHNLRIQLANALTNLGRDEEAEAILVQGRILKDDEVINRALANFSIMLHDQTEDFDQRLALIQQSLSYDVNYIVAYQRLVEQFRVSVSEAPERATDLESMLLKSIAEGKSTALAHFAASSLYSIRGNLSNSKFHIERAFSLDPRFGIIANNLAWLLATDPEKEDLERAYELASDVVARFPDDSRFRDTLATVLLKQEKYTESLTQFEKILGKNSKKSAIHEKLSVIYTNLDRPELAKIHQNLAAEIKEKKQKP